MALREKVEIKTFTGSLHGELFVGADGLPELCVGSETYTTKTVPAVWSIMPINRREHSELFWIWEQIVCWRTRIAVAQREAEAEERDRAQQREVDARTAQEIDERRTDESVDD